MNFISRYSRIIFITALVYAAVSLYIFPHWIVDDAFIAFRYATNFAEHGVLTWNIGELPVEGYTGLVWTGLIGLTIKLGISPLTTVHTLGVISYFLGLWGLIRLVQLLQGNKISTLVASLLYLVLPILFTHAWSGLETTFFLALLIWVQATLVAVAKNPDSKKLLVVFSLLILLLGLTRPEGAAFGFISIFCLVAYWWVTKNRGNIKTSAPYFVLLFLLPAIIYFVWRAKFYGALLPNTFYAKRVDHFSLSNIADLVRFLKRTFGLLAVAVLVLFVPQADRLILEYRAVEKKSPQAGLIVWLLAVVLFSLLLLLEFSHTHLIMNYAFRFYLPLLPALWVLFGLALDYGFILWRTVQKNQPAGAKLVALLTLLALGGQLFMYLNITKDEYVFASTEQRMLAAEHIAVGKWLRDVVPPNEWLVVYEDAGAIPYYSRLKTVDFGGLSDITLGRQNLTPSARIDYFFAHRPGAVVITSVNPKILDYGEEVAAITSDPRFKEYTLVRRYVTDQPERAYNEFVYLRNDLLSVIVLAPRGLEKSRKM